MEGGAHSPAIPAVADRAALGQVAAFRLVGLGLLRHHPAPLTSRTILWVWPIPPPDDRDVSVRTHHELIFLAVGVVVAALIGWHRAALLVRPLDMVTLWLSRSPWRAGTAVTLTCLALSLLTGLWAGIHYPGTHDEFGYLLQADTFCQGRLSNPAHPFWQHFESMHIIQQPTYQAKYPPGQGLAIALGQATIGIPMAGIWLSCALCAAAVWWMLAAWVPPRWAVLGGLLWAFKLAPSNWAQSFWGGAVACTGGALLLGGLRRSWDRPTFASSLAIATGTSLLAMTRPYEGLVLTMFVAGTLLYRAVQAGWSPALIVGKLCLPALIALVPAGVFLTAYNSAVTGDWKRMPYAAHDVQYSANPTFLFSHPIPVERIPEYRHSAMRDYYVGWERLRWTEKASLYGFNPSLATKLWGFFRFYVGGPFLIPIIAFSLAPRRSWWTFAVAGVGIALLANTQTLYLYAHYIAGITGLMFFLGITGMRLLNRWKPGARPIGKVLSGLTVLSLLMGAFGPPLSTLWSPLETQTARSRMEKQIRATRSGKHLLFVSYLPDHNIHDEWVYNGAQIDACEFVWARSISPERDAELAAYYPDRTVWQLTTGHTSIAAVPTREPLPPYPTGTSPARAKLFPTAPFERYTPSPEQSAPSRDYEESLPVTAQTDQNHATR